MTESGDYISREAAIRIASGYCHPANIAEELSKLPAADVRPVVRASWKRIDFKPCGHDYECSLCRWKNDMATKYCPNCGARMEES